FESCKIRNGANWFLGGHREWAMPKNRNRFDAFFGAVRRNQLMNGWILQHFDRLLGCVENTDSVEYNNTRLETDPKASVGNTCFDRPYCHTFDQARIRTEGTRHICF